MTDGMTMERMRAKCEAVIAFDGEYQRVVEAVAKSPIAEMGRYDAYLRLRSTIDLHGPTIARTLLAALDVVEAAEAFDSRMAPIERRMGALGEQSTDRLAVLSEKLAAFRAAMEVGDG